MSYERVLGWSLGASVLLHFALLFLSPSFLRIGSPPGQATDETDRFVRQQMEMIVAVASEDAPMEEEQPATSETLPVARTTTAPPSPAFVPRAGESDAEPDAVPPGAMPEAEQRSGGLQIGPRDPRLWVNPREVPLPQQSDRERYMEHLQARLDAMNDSIMGQAERERRARDWTFTDSEGRRWGLSPEGLHVGGVTVPRALVPLPGPTGDNQRLEGEREIRRQRDEIRRQEERGDRRRGNDDGS